MKLIARTQNTLRVARWLLAACPLALSIGLLSQSAAAQEQADNATPELIPPAPETRALAGQGQASKPVFKPQTERLEITDLKQQLSSETGLTGEAADEWISDHVRSLIQTEPKASQPKRWTSVTVADGTIQTLALDANGCGFLLHENELWIAAPTQATLQRVSNSIQRIRQTGIRQIFLRVRVLQAVDTQMQSLGLRWSHVETVSQIASDTTPEVVAASATAQPKPMSIVAMQAQGMLRASFESQREREAKERLEPRYSHKQNNWIEATSIVERATPVLYTILTPDELAGLMSKVHENDAIAIVNSPSVTVFNGNTATIDSMTERPLVTSVEVQKTGSGDNAYVHFVPKTRVYPQGTSLTLLPRLVDGEHVRLKCIAEQFAIRNIETLEVPVGDRRVTVQLPEIAKTQFRSQMEVPVGYAMAISMTDTNANGQRISTLTICQCDVDEVREFPTAK